MVELGLGIDGKLCTGYTTRLNVFVLGHALQMGCLFVRRDSTGQHLTDTSTASHMFGPTSNIATGGSRKSMQYPVDMLYFRPKEYVIKSISSVPSPESYHSLQFGICSHKMASPNKN